MTPYEESELDGLVSYAEMKLEGFTPEQRVAFFAQLREKSCPSSEGSLKRQTQWLVDAKFEARRPELIDGQWVVDFSSLGAS